MPEAFIVNKTVDVVSIDFGGEIDGVMCDGHIDVKEGESFYDWTFKELQDETATTITYQIPQEGDDE